MSKRVVDGAGNQLGIVAEVEDGTAYVDPDRDMASQLKSKLGWGATHEDTYPLKNDAIAEVTGDEIRLRDEYAGD